MSKLLLFLIMLAFGLANFNALAYEKVLGWSARWSSLAGAASSAVEGADAIYFNPAGMVNGPSNEWSANFSPTFSEFAGPNTPSNGDGERADSQTSERGMSPFFGLLYQQKINKKVSVGTGVYAVGGTNVEYKDVDFSNIRLNNIESARETIKSQIKIIEFSLAGAYRYSKNLSFGIAWRIVKASGELQSVGASLTDNPAEGAAVLGISLKDLEDTQYGGYRLGIQYMNDSKKFGAGFSMRNAVDLELEGQSSGFVDLAATPNGKTALKGGDIKASNSFPYQFSLGFFLETL